jgi:hypothetical protein
MRHGICSGPSILRHRSMCGGRTHHTSASCSGSLHAEHHSLWVTQSLPDVKQDFRAYLNPLGYLETHYTRMMSSLSSMAYRMDRLTPRYIRRLHGLELRYTSLACERVLTSDPQPAFEAHRFGDGACHVPSLCTSFLVSFWVILSHYSSHLQVETLPT